MDSRNIYLLCSMYLILTYLSITCNTISSTADENVTNNDVIRDEHFANHPSVKEEIQEEDGKGFVNNEENDDDSEKRKNEIIRYKYETVISELLPNLISPNATDAYTKLIKLLTRDTKRRKRRFKKQCGRRYTVISKYLEKELQKMRKKSLIKYKLNCKKKDIAAEFRSYVTGFTNSTIELTDELASDNMQKIDSNWKRVVQEDEYYESTVIHRYCRERGHLDSDGTLKLCTECYVQRDLGLLYYPRFINQIECGNHWPEDFFCFSGEGICSPTAMYIKFRYDHNGVGFDRLYDWEEYDQAIQTSCACQISRHSLFSDFL